MLLCKNILVTIKYNLLNAIIINYLIFNSLLMSLGTRNPRPINY